MAFFKYKNKNIFYEISGSGEPLILLHGNSVSSKMFNHILKYYEEDYEVICIDFSR